MSARVTYEMLQQKFVAGLDRRLARLHDCLTTLRDTGDHLPVVDEMTRGFHSLAGIGGTYGYTEITDVARNGELVCRNLGDRVSESDIDTLAGVLTVLDLTASSARCTAAVAQ